MENFALESDDEEEEGQSGSNPNKYFTCWRYLLGLPLWGFQSFTKKLLVKALTHSTHNDFLKCNEKD